MPQLLDGVGALGGQQQVIPQLAGRLGGARGELHLGQPETAARGGKQQRQDAGALALQAAGQQVGPVPELRGGPLDAPPGGRGHGAGAVERGGRGTHGDPGPLGHVTQRGHEAPGAEWAGSKRFAPR
ncbi:hypothetical protein GCM10020220_089870 [Nonomuraea rubra]